MQPAPVTNEGPSTNPFPWSTKLAGVSVTTDRCNGIETTALPILFVGPSGTGTQINLYYPNDIGNEPLGTCRTTDTFDLISVAPKPGFEIAFTTGGEIFACPTASQPCNAARRLTFSLTAPGGQPVEQPLSFYNQRLLVRLGPATTG